MFETADESSTLETFVLGGGKEFQIVKPSDLDENSRIIILIHGFTSHGKELVKLATMFKTIFEDYLVLFFNYHSYNGVDAAAKSLHDMIENYNKFPKGAIFNKDVFIVSHSMGGLVARKFLLHENNRQLIRGLVMLGTPNRGTLNHRLVEYFFRLNLLSKNFLLDIKENCLSARELTNNDHSEKQRLIEVLNEQWYDTSDITPTFTVSGGKKYLVIDEKSPLRNKLFNFIIQKMLNHEPNDGLVPEDSVNLIPEIAHPDHIYKHDNQYAEFPNINHSNLIRSQVVLLIVANWINERCNLTS